ncbi:nucleotidyltransferase [Jeotgalibacillus sp. ET6]|uniref:nucleotidyltransferase n=1 Tax=Jeotgalibacillus sp. ET6 TaxID=3037260 RepID=UPI0024186CA3|nr:nucleotidyltransferase [Jeotgalibacillus sp. ET6]MDG5470183.1 nucleotidyltransferase [Jeotgalibacillus sp. ET6]
MKATGIVVEYNPFHNGHLLHAAESRRSTGNDVVIAVMSGPFLQRGEPALASKWSRTRMALASGVDIVIELPFPYAVQHATHFAAGSVQLLNSIGCSSLCFGSEDGSVKPFVDTVKWRRDNQEVLDHQIQYYSKRGLSYPSAVAQSYEDLTSGQLNRLDLSKPNNMLGLQYMEAIEQYAPAIRPYTIKRQSSDYHDPLLHENKISSATSIRKTISESSLAAIQDHVPAPSYKELSAYYEQTGQFHSWTHYWPVLQHLILTKSPQELGNYYEMEEGIQYRLVEAAKSCQSFNSFMEAVKTKRYTWTRIQRILTHLLNGSKKEEIFTHLTPSYLRLLGMNEKGRNYLQQHKKQFSLPLISRIGKENEQLLRLDIRAGLVYAMGLQNRKARQQLMDSDFKQPPIIFG